MRLPTVIAVLIALADPAAAGPMGIPPPPPDQFPWQYLATFRTD